MGWFATLRRHLVPHLRPARDDDLVRLVVTPLEQRRVLSVTAVDVSADLVVDEGSLVEIHGSYTDPVGSPNNPHKVTVNWDDGTLVEPPVNQNDGQIDVDHYYADNGEYHPIVTVAGKDEIPKSSDPEAITITVLNVAPTLTVTQNKTVEEDSLLQITDLGKFTDPGFNDTFTYSIDWGDGTSPEVNLKPTIDTEGEPGIPTAGSFDGSHVYADDGLYTVTVTIKDNDGGTDERKFDVTVTDTGPPISITATPSEINENGSVTLNGSLAGEGQGTQAVLVDWGDGTSPESLMPESDGTFTANHQYLDDNPTATPSDDYTITASFIGQQGMESAQTVVTVNNLNPSIDTLQITSPIDEHGIATLSGTYSDAGTQDTHQLDIDWDGNDSYEETVVVSDGSFSLNHQYLDDTLTGTSSDTLSVKVRLRDDDSGEDTDSVPITINNVDPVIDVTILNPVIDEDGSVTLNGSITDQGTLDSHSILIDWGDGSSPEPVTPTSGGTFTATHQYLDDNPTGTLFDDYTITATVTDDDTGTASALATVTVNNVAPVVSFTGDTIIDEGSSFSGSGTFSDPGTDTWTATVDYGDGSGAQPLPLAPDKTFNLSHIYADDGDFTVTVTVYDDDLGSHSDTFTVEVVNVNPTLDAGPDLTGIDEGTFIALGPATFTDPGFDNPPGGTSEDFTATINWGDGTVEPAGDITVTETPGSEGVLTTGTINAAHAYADDGLYTVTVTVEDDNGGIATDTFTVEVVNVNPTLDAGPDQTGIDEGTSITLAPATFTDPGFDNPPGGTSEGFTATINWGDGTVEPAGDITVTETPGSEGVLTTGTINATHAYADDGLYTVTVTVEDDNGGIATDTFTVEVVNVNPTLDAGPDLTGINEGTFITLAPATFTDSGFDNSPGGTSEDFTATINWGDGTVEPAADITVTETPGSEGVFTTGTINATHAYADDGLYTVTVTVEDDNGGIATDTFTVEVVNVNPTLDAGPDQTGIDEGTSITLAPATFTDPGFDNPPGGTSEDFTATINWGDGTVEPAADITVTETPGSEGVFTTGTINATHAYADDGLYTVTVTVEDDNGGIATDTFTVEVVNVNPTLDAGPDQTGIDEGTFITLAPATFTDPGFDNPPGGTSEDFTATINWGDGTVEPAADITVTETPGSEGVFTTGTINATHAYADDGLYTVTVTVEDDNGGIATDTFTVEVVNVNPTLDAGPDQTGIDEGTFITLGPATFTDPGFDNSPGGTSEDFTATINWGDGTVEPAGDITLVETPGSEGTLTTGNITATHAYADDGLYTVTVTVEDDNGGIATDTFTVEVVNVNPTLDAGPDLTGIDEGTFIALGPATFTDPGFDNPPGGTSEDFTATINWGDGTVEPAADITVTETPGSEGVFTTGTINATHAYADDGLYTVTVTVEDDNGGIATDTFTVEVVNVNPTLDAGPDQTGIDEGTFITLAPATFTDPGFDNPPGSTSEDFTATINWGDGTVEPAGDITLVETPGSEGTLTTGTINATHAYADDGLYTVTVTVEDDNGGIATDTFTVEVVNVNPTLTVVDDQTIDEGAELALTDIGTFTDPGFDNPNNTTGETEETFTYSIDWGDGTGIDGGDATVDIHGADNVLTEGSFDGAHIYADNGTYTVTVTVFDDDGGSDSETFEVTVVNNVSPDLTVVADQTIDEGAELSLTDVGTFTDPGFDNPDNPTGEVEETFTYTIDWGDGTPVDAGDATVDVPGEDNVPTSGSFDGAHTYADNGVYTVTVTVYDDDDGSDTETFAVTVNNVVPGISGVTGHETVDEGSAFTLAELGWAIEDPGFDNADNTTGEVEETFTGAYTVDWGDGTPVESGAIVDRVSGSPGVLTVAEFGELPHTYADNGVYTVLITFGDDDSEPVIYALEVTVANVASSVTPAAEQTVDEGALLEVTDLATFTDPGFDNAANPTGPSVETFRYEIDWGDGTTTDAGDATIDLHGSVGVATEGSFDGSHVYADNGVYTVTLTVTDDDGGATTVTTYVTVLNVDPTVLHFDDNEVDTTGTVTVEGDFSDPGFDNPQNPLSPPHGSEESFDVVVDWGDGTYDTIHKSDEEEFTATHTYVGPVDPANPADDILIVVTVTDDDGGFAVAETYAEVPGEGVEFVYIDTTPKVPRLVFPRPLKLDAGNLGATFSEFLLSSAEYESARPDSAAASENFIVLRTVLPDGDESIDYRMPDNALEVLPQILRRLPDNRYRVYEIQSDGPERLVRDVFVRQKHVIDQTDASEGMEERAPQMQIDQPDAAAPDLDDSTSNSPDETWERWEARNSTTELVSDDVESIADPPSATQRAGASTAGTALLAFRLRANRSQDAKQMRERFAHWNPFSPKKNQAYPKKPR